MQFAAKVGNEPKLRGDLVPRGMSFEGMKTAGKACPVVVRLHNGQREVLAFTHPSAGNQFVTGAIETGESTLEAAVRELWKESGLSMC